MRRWLMGALLAVLFGGPMIAQAQAQAELIVLAAPRADDPYYGQVRDGILAFHVAFAQAITARRDNVLVLVDRKSYTRYRNALGADRVLVAPQQDIWMRDFGPVLPERPAMFRYTAAGQGGARRGQRTADDVQEDLAVLLAEAGLRFASLDLKNDGGNIVHDDAGNAVLSRKFLRDNALDEAAARRLLRTKLGLKNVAFIEADEQGGLEHADGVVAFVETNTLIVNSYPGDPAYAAALRRDLERGLPGVAIHEIVTPYDGSEIYDGRFGSACGLYTNALVTPDRVYLPQFGIREDATALSQVRAVTRREVVPVASQQVCHMGGGVRCMSLQLRGQNAARFLSFATRAR